MIRSPASLLCSLAVTLGTLSALRGQGPQHPCYDTQPLDAVGSSLVSVGAPAGATLWLCKDGEVLYHESFGGYSGGEVLPLASATKWLSGAVIMSLVDDGLLTLDDTAGQWLPGYSGVRATMTVRQMMSHTAGLPSDHPAVSDRTLTLEQAAAQMASVPLVAPPGAEFRYGNVSMHLAGRIAELAGGKTWGQLFRERIATPCGMSQTDFAAFGLTFNPRIAGGARSTVGDYSRFLSMLVDGGRSGGQQVLSAAAIEAMVSDQTMGVPIAYTPAPDQRRYGIGCWTDRVDGVTTLQVSSPGAFGYTPWIDWERGLAGIVAVRSLRSLVVGRVDQVMQWSLDDVHYRGVRCVQSSSPSCAAILALDSGGVAAAGASVFELRVSGGAGAAGGIGALGIGLQTTANPWPVAGADVWLDPAGLVTFPLALGPTGHGVFTADLSALPPGAGFAAQAVVLDPAGCAGLLRASEVLSIELR